MSKKITFITLGTLALIIPAGFTLAGTQAQTSTVIERQEFDFAVSSQKEVDTVQDERISKLESFESSTVDFTDLGKEAIDSLPKSSTPSVNNNMSKKQAISTPTVTQPVTEPVVETPKNYVYQTEMLAGVGYNNGMAKQKEMQCKFKCWSTIVETDPATGLVKAFYMTFENEQELIKLFSYPVKYTKVEI